MSNILLAELLIIAILLPPVTHTFAKKKEAARAVPVLIPVALIFLFLTTIAFGLSASILVLWVAAIFVLLCNIAQLLRFCLRLTADRSVFSYAAAVIQLAVLMGAATFCIIFMPVPPQMPEKVITSQTFPYMSAGQNKFVPKEKLTQRSDVLLTLFYPAEITEKTPLVMYLPDIYANAADCSATAGALAEKGYLVALADFNLKNGAYGKFPAASFRTRPFLFRMREYFTPKQFAADKKTYIEEKEIELECFFAILKDNESPVQLQERALYLLAEGNIKSLAEKFKEQYPEEVSGVYYIHTALNPIPGYINGYGNAAVFHPFEAFLRGTERDSQRKQAALIAQFAAEDWIDTN